MGVYVMVNKKNEHERGMTSTATVIYTHAMYACLIARLYDRLENPRAWTGNVINSLGKRKNELLGAMCNN